MCELSFGERYTASRLRSRVRSHDRSIFATVWTHHPHPAGSIAPLSGSYKTAGLVCSPNNVLGQSRALNMCCAGRGVSAGAGVGRCRQVDNHGQLLPRWAVDRPSRQSAARRYRAAAQAVEHDGGHDGVRGRPVACATSAHTLADVWGSPPTHKDQRPVVAARTIYRLHTTYHLLFNLSTPFHRSELSTSNNTTRHT